MELLDCALIGKVNINIDKWTDRGKMDPYMAPACFICAEILQPSQPTGVILNVVSLPNHTISWAGLVL